MSENSKIEWAHHTFNPWEGCQHAGPGCDNCYAEARNARFAKGIAINWGPGSLRRRTSEANWQLPYRWNRNHDKFFALHGQRQRVFCSSLSDVFDNAVDPQWRIEMFRVIAETKNLDWLLLTKRIGNAYAMLDRCMSAYTHGREGWRDNYLPNVWLGATIVNQEEADRDIPKLMAVPAAKRFLSMEPLLGPVNLGAWIEPWNMCGYCGESFDYEQDRADLCPECGQTGCMCTGFGSELRNDFDDADGRLEVPDDGPGIDWVIVGGESGPYARPMHPDWARSLRDQCVAAGVPYLFKQWGAWNPGNVFEAVGAKHETTCIDQSGQVHPYPPIFEPSSGRWCMHRLGKKAAGRLLDGRTWDEVPS